MRGLTGHISRKTVRVLVSHSLWTKEHMKIITLNTWGGRAGKELLLSFFEKYRDDADIFCLQEIWSAPHI